VYPYIHTSLGVIEVFKLFVATGVALMVLILYYTIKKEDRLSESAFIFPRLVTSGLIGFLSAMLFDFIFMFLKYGVFRIYGITFYGGLLGASAAMYCILIIGKDKTKYTVSQWFNKLTIPFVIFHIFGRIGCFFGGCCYGRYSECFLAIAFPDNPEMGIIHNGMKCFPTQLFEVCALLIIMVIVIVSKNKYRNYMVLYSFARFSLEFLRGDDRGTLFSFLSPSQMISVFIIVGIVFIEIKKHFWKTAVK